jgi:hypothetical protein
MLFSANTAANVAFALGAAIVSFFLIRHSRRYLSRAGTSSTRPATTKPESPDETRITTSTDVMRGQVQLHDMARELMGQLDSKMSALQALIRLANEAAARLEAAADRAERLGRDGGLPDNLPPPPKDL